MTGADFGEVDIDLLADYIGGVLTGTPDESVVAALIAGDPRWSAAHASLSDGMTAVGAELSGWAPEPMPADLAARLDDLFAAAPGSADVSPADSSPAESSPAESSPADSSPADAGSASAGDEATAVVTDAGPIDGELATPDTPRLRVIRGDGAARASEPPGVQENRKRKGRRMRFAAPIAVAAGVVAFVGFGLDYLAGRDDTAHESAASSAGEAARPAPAMDGPGVQVLTSGMNYSLGTLDSEPAQPFIAQESGNPALSSPKLGGQDPDGQDRGGQNPGGQGPSGQDSGGPGAGSLPSRTSEVGPERGGPVADPAEALRRLVAPDALQTCLDEIERENADGDILVRTVDYARFESMPAVIVRFSTANGQWAWASGPSCGTPGSGADTLGKVPVR